MWKECTLRSEITNVTFVTPLSIQIVKFNDIWSSSMDSSYKLIKCQEKKSFIIVQTNILSRRLTAPHIWRRCRWPCWARSSTWQRRRPWRSGVRRRCETWRWRRRGGPGGTGSSSLPRRATGTAGIRYEASMFVKENVVLCAIWPCNQRHCMRFGLLNSGLVYDIYRAWHLVADLGWADFDLGCSTILPCCYANSALF